MKLNQSSHPWTALSPLTISWKLQKLIILVFFNKLQKQLVFLNLMGLFCSHLRKHNPSKHSPEANRDILALEEERKTTILHVQHQMALQWSMSSSPCVLSWYCWSECWRKQDCYHLFKGSAAWFAAMFFKWKSLCGFHHQYWGLFNARNQLGGERNGLLRHSTCRRYEHYSSNV